MTLFTTGCPRCRVLERKLEAKSVEFEVDDDMSEVIGAGFASAPILKLDDGRYLDFAQANAYINAL